MQEIHLASGSDPVQERKVGDAADTQELCTHTDGDGFEFAIYALA
ncbi:MAG: hypothetical protein PHU77_09180 [Simplicispira sp.]|nr:hypothetical protein [Simplicispira sp.]